MFEQILNLKEFCLDKNILENNGVFKKMELGNKNVDATKLIKSAIELLRYNYELE